MAFVPIDLSTDASNVDAAGQLTAANTVLWNVFEAVLNFLYTVISILISFFTQPAVLGAVAVIGIIYGAYRMLKRKRLS